MDRRTALPYVTADGLAVYDLSERAPELWVVAGPAGADPDSIDPGDIPDGWRWVSDEEWESLAGGKPKYQRRERRIRQTYDIVTPESAEHGDYAESGWIDEEGTPIEPDQWDMDKADWDYFTAVVAVAVSTIEREGSVEPSSSEFCSGVWYSTIGDEIDYRTGEHTRYHFHLTGFTREEEKAIFAAIRQRN